MALQLEMGEKQANIANKEADTAKKFSEADQNEIENAVQVAELAAQQQNQALLNQALSEIVALVQGPQALPAPTVGLTG